MWADEQERQERAKRDYEAGYSFAYRKVCPSCGKIFYIDHAGRKYCSRRCAWIQQKRNEKTKRRNDRAKFCEVCGRFFLPDRAGAKYCSAACKQKAYRNRRQIGAGWVSTK